VRSTPVRPPGNGGGVALNSVSDVPFHYCSFIGNASDITTADYGGGGFYATAAAMIRSQLHFFFNRRVLMAVGFEKQRMNGFVMRYTTFSQEQLPQYMALALVFQAGITS